MKKTKFFLFAAMLFTTSIQAQEAFKKVDDDDSFAKKGDQTINLYYGISLFNNIYRNVAAANATDLQFKSLGPIGIMYEYFVADKVGVGMELGYSKFEFSYSYDFDSFTTGTVSTTQTFKDTWTFTNIRAMFRANFHFVDSKTFDAYGFFSAGYRNTSYNFTSTNPNANSLRTFNSIIPFGIKPGIGIRYFFTTNIGLNAEFALGTPLMSGGLSFKF